MKYLKLLLLLVFFSSTAFSQDPSSPSWAVYASGVGQKLSPGMDPCWVTYTVAFPSDPKIAANVAAGTMGLISSGLNWYEATRLQRRFSRYFDDEPDGVFKLSPCEFFLATGSWSGWGGMTLTGGSASAKGTYSDTYDKSKGVFEIKRVDGKWSGTWGEPSIGRKGLLYDIQVSTDGKSISGKYNVTSDGGKGNKVKDQSFKWTYSGSMIKN